MKLRKLILISFLSLHIVAAHAGVPATTPVQQRSITLEEAITAAYRLSAGVKFANAYSRSDIGQRALQAKK